MLKILEQGLSFGGKYKKNLRSWTAGGDILLFLSAAVDVHDAQLGLFDPLVGIQLGRGQDIAGGTRKIFRRLIEGDKIKRCMSLAHDPSGMASAAGGAASDDLNIVEAEHRTGIAVTEGRQL